MQTEQSIEMLDNGKMRIHKRFDAAPSIKDLDQRRNEIGKGFTQTKEMRHVVRIPNWLRGVDPAVDEYCKHPNDKFLKTIVLARYPKLKVCEGGIR